jgi:hypothetical protein
VHFDLVEAIGVLAGGLRMGAPGRGLVGEVGPGRQREFFVSSNRGGEMNQIAAFEYTAAPRERHLTANELRTLRFVKAGDPYRDKGRGKPGRVARHRTLERLRGLGLVRVTQQSFWRCTGRGCAVLLANPPKSSKR